MSGQGTTEVDFGAFPGSSWAKIAVTGQTGILSASHLVEAWIYPKATVDHSADEHLIETVKAIGGNIVDGVGFTIYAWNTSVISEPVLPMPGIGNTRGTVAGGRQTVARYNLPTSGGKGTRLYGKFTVAWVWN